MGSVNDLAEAWAAYREDDDQDALDYLVRKYAPLAGYLAQRALVRAPEHQEASEILAFAQDGLLDALRKFDPDQGAKFETYATRRIAGEIVDGLRRKDPLGRTARRQVKTVESAVAAFTALHRRRPTLEETAGVAGLDVADVRLTQLLGKTTNDSIENPMHSQRFTSESDAEASSQVDELATLIAHRLALMPAHERAVVLAYYVDERNLKKTAEVLRMSPGRCRRIRASIWSHLAGGRLAHE
jgi:RNA polymerase sigma factor for flagellar operon FliA